MMSKSIVTPPRASNKKSDNNLNNSGNNADIDSDDRMVGHCSISLEQLCKVALANAATSTATVAAPRILVHRGRPMHNLDAKTLQVSLLFLFCFLSSLYLCSNRIFLLLPFLERNRYILL
jgi:hypothetical protein